MVVISTTEKSYSLSDMVLQGNEDHETILMMMLCSRHEKRDKDKFGAPKKITQCSTIHALKVGDYEKQGIEFLYVKLGLRSNSLIE